MKATSIEEILLNFNHQERLSDDRLRTWFVEREDSQRGLLCKWMITQKSPQGVLFIGHRGSGKSTELNKLVVELTEHFVPVAFSVFETSKIHRLEIEDVLLLLVTQVARSFVDRGHIAEPLLMKLQEPWQRFLSWWQHMVTGVSVKPPPDEASLSTKLSLWLVEVEASLSRSAETRDALRAAVRANTPELLQYLDWIVEQVEKLDGRRVLIIVEDLDKISLEAALSIFKNHGALLRAPNAMVVYTCPSALLYSPDFNEVRQTFSRPFILPNIPPRTRSGGADKRGQKSLTEMIFRRMESELIHPKALQRVIYASGGVPSSLMRLMQNAALYATGDIITPEDVGRAILDERELVTPTLTKANWAVLQQRHADHGLTADEDNRDVIYRGALLEYRSGRDGRPWCDAHPILWDLLDEPMNPVTLEPPGTHLSD